MESYWTLKYTISKISDLRPRRFFSLILYLTKMCIFYVFSVWISQSRLVFELQLWKRPFCLKIFILLVRNLYYQNVRKNLSYILSTGKNRIKKRWAAKLDLCHLMITVRRSRSYKQYLGVFKLFKFKHSGIYLSIANASGVQVIFSKCNNGTYWGPS